VGGQSICPWTVGSGRPIPDPHRQRPASWPACELAITILRLAGYASIAAALRHHARGPGRPLKTIMNCRADAVGASDDGAGMWLPRDTLAPWSGCPG
jgi:hypothetical protein